MNIYYQGTDITEYCQVKECVYTDALSRADTLELTLENADSFKKWGPEENDVLRVTHKKIDTGKMYVSAVLPAANTYQILATALPADAGAVRYYASFQNATLSEIADYCAKSAGLDGFRLYGADGSTKYSYIIQDCETAAGFLERIAKWEGALLKIYDGNFIIADIITLQQTHNAITIETDGLTAGYDYFTREGLKLYGLEIKTPSLSVMAYDSACAGAKERTYTNIPARDYAEAGRWARGLLLDINRKADVLNMDGTLNPAYTAMARVDVSSGKDERINGRWMVERCEHDLKNERSDASLVRVIETIS